MFLFGKPIAGGITGKNPLIPSNPTDYDNLDMEFDFRSVYGTLLRDWFCVPKDDVPGILLHDLPYLDVFEPNISCISTATHQANQAAGKSMLDCAPNPFSSQLQITYRTEGGPTTIQILDVSGKIIATVAHGFMNRGEYVVDWQGDRLPSGTYFCRILNGLQQQTRTIVKIGNN
jgi:hypothetical protein